MTLLDQVRQTIARYAMLRPGDQVGVAVSGGADSLCLLHVLLELRSEFDLGLSILHVDHNLRGPQSQEDARFVHNFAQQLDLPFHLRTLNLDPGRGNLEQEARRARYQFFRELIRDGMIQKVAIGHTRSDQAETVLFRLLRGAGSAGLAGIRPVTNSGVIRPLLQVSRSQVEAWLRQRDISWREDETNTQLRFARNRIRHQVLPGLEAEWNPNLSETLAQTADWAFEEEQYWRREIPRLMEDWVCFAKGAAVLDTDRLNALPVAAARRVIREVVKKVKGDLLGVNFSHIEAARRLGGRAKGSGRVEITGVGIVRSFNWLRFVTPEQPTAMHPQHAPLIHLELVRNNGVYNSDVDALDWEKVGERADRRLVLRYWRPGDQYQRRGHDGPEKLKKLFQEHRVPLWERQDWPIISIGDSVAWAYRFGCAAQFAVDASSEMILRIRTEDRGVE